VIVKPLPFPCDTFEAHSQTFGDRYASVVLHRDLKSPPVQAEVIEAVIEQPGTGFGHNAFPH
ncbi:uncharacterized protein METZ01_LOCUS14000, partial [marine metagenome]